MSNPNRSFNSTNPNTFTDSTINSEDLLSDDGDFEYYDVQVIHNNIPTESTPIRMDNLPQQHETFGSSINRRGDTFDPRHTRVLTKSSEIDSFFLNQSTGSGYLSSEDEDWDRSENENFWSVSDATEYMGLATQPSLSTSNRNNLPGRHPTFGSNIMPNEMPFQSTPNRSNLPPRHLTFGSPINANDRSNYGLDPRFLERSMEESSDIDSRFFEQSSDIQDTRDLSRSYNPAQTTSNRSANLQQRPPKPPSPGHLGIPSSFFDNFVDTPSELESRNVPQQMPLQSTPNANARLPSRHVEFGSPINANQSSRGMPSRYLQRSMEESSDIDTRFFDQSSDINGSGFSSHRRGMPSRYLERSMEESPDIDTRFFDQSSDINSSGFSSHRQMPSQSTPNSRLPSRHQEFGSPINANTSSRGMPSRYLERSMEESSDIDTRFFDQSSDINSSGFSSHRQMPSQSTPNASSRLPSRHQEFGSPINANTSSRGMPSRYLERSMEESSDIDTRFFDQSSDIKSSGFSSHRQMPLQSTLNANARPPSRHVEFGSPINANQSSRGMPSRYLEGSMEESSDIDTRFFDQSSDIKSSGFSSPQCLCTPAHSTPNRIGNACPQFQTFGSSIRNGNDPSNIGIPSQYLEKSGANSSDIDSRFFEQSSDIQDSAELSCFCNPAQSTPNRIGNLPSRHLTFGSPINAQDEDNHGLPSSFLNEFVNTSSDSGQKNIAECLCTPAHSTPNRIGNASSQYETFGSPIRNATDTPNFGVPSQYLENSTVNSSDIDSRNFEQSSDIQNSRSLLKQNCLCSTPNRRSNLPSRHPTFGSPINENDTPNYGIPSRYLNRSANTENSSDIRSSFFEKSSDGANSNRQQLNMSSEMNSSFFQNSFVPQMLGPHSPNKSKSPSIIEWFDKTVEKELRRRAGSLNGENLVNIESPSTSGEGDVIPPSEPFVLDANTSRVDIEADLRCEPQTELYEAIDKLAKAEAMCVFEGAVRAAERAAASVSPEYAEEAAAAGAQGFQAEITNVVEQEISGPKPIEVLGYVGITRPKKPKKSNFTLN